MLLRLIAIRFRFINSYALTYHNKNVSRNLLHQQRFSKDKQPFGIDKRIIAKPKTIAFWPVFAHKKACHYKMAGPVILDRR
jgi:hypothetical protein